ncbi:hypothetical protein [Fluviicola sp.]|uniref:hypothetical protein n=1 Tax=Fluviicola sp. TaxID=1917219 RepID=UPI0026317976|nr:hypothetical protein [Fluviicola sp.]
MNFADNNILLILISLVFIYAVLSILVSILTEWWNSYFKERGIFLKDSIYKLLKDPINKDYGYLLYNHVTIAGLKSAPDRDPHYISGTMFAEALIDIIAQQVVNNQKVKVVMNADGTREYQMENNSVPGDIVERFQLGVSGMNTSPFADLMQSFIDKSAQAENQYAELKKHIEQWYNDYMDRVSGWYKTKQRKKFIIAGFAVAIVLNVDSLHLLKMLSLDPNLRDRMVESAEQTAANIRRDSTFRTDISSMTKVVSIPQNDMQKARSFQIDTGMAMEILNKLNAWDSTRKIADSTAKRDLKQLNDALNLVSELNVPIGWSETSAPVSWFQSTKEDALPDSKNPGLVRYLNERNNDPDTGTVLKYLIGIIISGISLSFGAPFWFELLVKFVNIRRSGKIPEGNPSTKS